MCVALTGVKGVTASRDRRGGGGGERGGERRMPEGIITGKRERGSKMEHIKIKSKKGRLSAQTTSRKK